MKAINRLVVIRHKSKINKNWKHTDLFCILRKPAIWIRVYKNIKSNKVVLIQVIRKKILNRISIQRLIRLSDKVIP